MASREERGSPPAPTGVLLGPGGRPGHGRPVERAKDARGALRRLATYLRPHRGALAVVGLVASLGTGVALAAPYFLGRAIDQLIGRNPEGLARQSLLMLAAYSLSALAQLAQGVLVAALAQRVMRVLRADLFGHLQVLPLRYFDGRSQGDLMGRLTNDTDALSRVLTDNVSQLSTGALSVAGILVILFALNLWLALASLVVLAAMVGLVGAVGRGTRTAFRAYQADLGALNAVLEETFSAQRVVLAYGQEEGVLSHFERANEKARSTGTKAMALALLAMPMMGILANANVAVLGGLGGWMAIRGLITVGTLTAFISYSRRFAEPLRQLGDLYNQIQGALAGAERIFEVLDAAPDRGDLPGAPELTRVVGAVEFEHVTFAYVPGLPVLQDVCLRVPPGERVAFVGPTGAGKTTLVNLLSRFYDLEEGSIRIDGADLRTLTRDSLRRQLGVVLQQSFLFAETVLENIRYGRLDATDDEVLAAARLARADGFIRRLPRGYDTVLSEGGASLSGGQRQLLTIARALLADPAILILDEATSSVDTRTEVQLQEALDALMKGRTSFVIAHRLSTIANADRVVVIERGRIVEQGTHEELCAAAGAYYRLYVSQFRGEPPVTTRLQGVVEAASRAPEVPPLSEGDAEAGRGARGVVPAL
ncbi:MAG: ABC transporter ATP-binding protein [Deltaproteobacteria bacterium]|nr:ABC transporter ATP-binding protein [Deltaproteobacteria bacterium]